jgi:hypothetical protein
LSAEKEITKGGMGMGMTDRAVRASSGTIGAKALTWTGVIHTVYGLLAYGAVLAAIAGDGVFNAIGSSPRPERDAALWFVTSGVLLIVLGRMAAWVQSTSAMLPHFLGWSVLGVAVVVGILTPASGWPLVAASGILLIARR